jgi:hypothetical protein
MCELSGKLMAWLDHELESDEMACVQRHIEVCIECRGQLETYREVSGTFAAYLDAVLAAKARRRVPRWVPVVSGAAAVGIAAAAFLVFQPMRVEPLVPSPSRNTAPSATVLEAAPAPTIQSKTVHRRHPLSPVQSQIANANWRPAELAIQIAIPAESMFPPGAVPEGITFTADVSIAADGSAQQIRLRPRLIGFERSATQP